MKWISVLFYVLLVKMATAQNVNRVEYFFDKDPGIGNAHAILVTPADTVRRAGFSIALDTESVGMHSLYIRAGNKDSWGPVEAFPFYIDQVNNIKMVTGAEYFIDKDSGVGKAITISPLKPGDTIRSGFSISAANQLPGMHSFNIRFRDEAGNFSHFESFPFYISSDFANMPKVVAAEYFFGKTDPGAGNATPLEIPTAGDTVLNSFFIPVTCAITKVDSTYSLYVRVKDEMGHWSLLENDSFNLRGPNTAITVKDGLWSDASVWSNHQVPVASTDVILKHTITVNIKAVCRHLFTFCNKVTINEGQTISVTGH